MGKQLSLADAQIMNAAASVIRGVTPQSVRGLEDALDPKALPAGEKIGESLRRMPAQKPGKSKQNYGTPNDLMWAVKAKFGIGSFAYDLAADSENTKATRYFTEAQNSLIQNWGKIHCGDGDLWLNPPFSRIAPWAEKCWVESQKRASTGRILFLVPAAPGSNWWRDFVHEKAFVWFLNGRPCFDGKNGFPKDIALAVYSRGIKAGYGVWSWQQRRSQTPAGKHSK